MLRGKPLPLDPKRSPASASARARIRYWRDKRCGLQTRRQVCGVENARGTAADQSKNGHESNHPRMSFAAPLYPVCIPHGDSVLVAELRNQARRPITRDSLNCNERDSPGLSVSSVASVISVADFPALVGSQKASPKPPSTDRSPRYTDFFRSCRRMSYKSATPPPAADRKSKIGRAR